MPHQLSIWKYMYLINEKLVKNRIGQIDLILSFKGPSIVCQTVTYDSFCQIGLCLWLLNRTTHPSPVRAQHACMCHPWSLTDVKLSCCEISAAVIAPFKSCLLANIRMAALRRSSQFNILYNSSLVMVNRSLSVLSMTKIMNWKNMVTSY